MLDLGTGTCRIPLLIADRTQAVVSVDLHLAMLRVNQLNQARGTGRWDLVQADMRELPFSNRWAEVVTAGWAIGHLRDWYPDKWQTEMARVLGEINRVAVPNATVVIFETLTTGSLTPAPPSDHLAEYYGWLEDVQRFSRHVFRTDYQFADLAEAVELTGFFFGSELATRVRNNNWVRVPEWTGMWIRHGTGSC